MIDIYCQYATSETKLPSEEDFEKWVTLALEAPFDEQCELTIRVVDDAESSHLNRTFRNKDYSTNVLSFPFPAPEGYENILGDMVLCAPVILKEAKEQNKKLMDHWAHLVIHGTLHLQGYDHQLEVEAEEMEAKEINILKKIGIDNPYECQ